MTLKSTLLDEELADEERLPGHFRGPDGGIYIDEDDYYEDKDWGDSCEYVWDHS
jgi:hypothetical protein